MIVNVCQSTSPSAVAANDERRFGTQVRCCANMSSASAKARRATSQGCSDGIPDVCAVGPSEHTDGRVFGPGRLVFLGDRDNCALQTIVVCSGMVILCEGADIEKGRDIAVPALFMVVRRSLFFGFVLGSEARQPLGRVLRQADVGTIARRHVAEDPERRHRGGTRQCRLQ